MTGSAHKTCKRRVLLVALAGTGLLAIGGVSAALAAAGSTLGLAATTASASGASATTTAPGPAPTTNPEPDPAPPPPPPDPAPPPAAPATAPPQAAPSKQVGPTGGRERIGRADKPNRKRPKAERATSSSIREMPRNPAGLEPQSPALQTEAAPALAVSRTTSPANVSADTLVIFGVLALSVMALGLALALIPLAADRVTLSEDRRLEIGIIVACLPVVLAIGFLITR